MSEKIDLNAAQKKLAETLKGIGIDLWGSGDPEQWAEDAFDASSADRMRERILAQAKREEAGETDGNPPAAPAAESAGSAARDSAGDGGETRKPAGRKRQPVGLENLWITADETIDWTEALISPSPKDGLTAPRLWSFYHLMAEKVLAGDVQAYAQVLSALNPLGDLREYVSEMVLRAPSPDRVECEFECLKAEMDRDRRAYLSALSVRIARDLLATLPVESIRVVGRMDGEDQLDVTFRRDQLLKRKMAFLKPAEFVAECGGFLREEA